MRNCMHIFKKRPKPSLEEQIHALVAKHANEIEKEPKSEKQKNVDRFVFLQQKRGEKKKEKKNGRM